MEALVEALSLRDFVLVGHSAGGRNAFLYTVRHPEMVRALVIVDIDPDAANPESASMFQRYKAESDEWGSLDAVIERLRSRQPNSTDETLAHQSRHMTRESPGGKRVWKRDRRLVEAYERPDLWAAWSRIECPTLIARGRQSNLLTHEVAVRMREAIPRARLAELEGGGHWFYQELPGPFEATIRWFLQAPPGLGVLESALGCRRRTVHGHPGLAAPEPSTPRRVPPQGRRPGAPATHTSHDRRNPSSPPPDTPIPALDTPTQLPLL